MPMVVLLTEMLAVAKCLLGSCANYFVTIPTAIFDIAPDVVDIQTPTFSPFVKGLVVDFQTFLVESLVDAS